MAATSEDLSPRRREILTAATTVLAQQGNRGLTHRAVDRAAGLSEGSSSAYFRTRDALLAALGDFVADQLAADGDVMLSADEDRGASAETLVAALDGVLLASLVLPPRRRKAFVSDSVEQLLTALGPDPREA